MGQNGLQWQYLPAERAWQQAALYLSLVPLEYNLEVRVEEMYDETSNGPSKTGGPPNLRLKGNVVLVLVGDCPMK